MGCQLYYLVHQHCNIRMYIRHQSQLLLQGYLLPDYFLYMERTGMIGQLRDETGGLRSEPHDLRAPDYDDWDLNGDIFFYDEVLQSGIELSSMGIRVDADSLVKQLKLAGAEDRLAHQYHQDVLNGVLPLTIGGGIGQSRLCMLILQKAHVGEVQVSMWPDEMKEICEKNEIFLL